MTVTRSDRTDNLPETQIDCANLLRANGYGQNEMNDQKVIVATFLEVRDNWRLNGYASLSEVEKVCAFEAGVLISAINLWGNAGRAGQLVWSFNQEDGPTWFRPNYEEST